MSVSAPLPSSDGARRTMKANRRSNTQPELRVRRVLHAAGLRYRVDYAPDRTNLRRRADIVFTRCRIAVFVDGCFWHGCPEHFIPPKANAEYWNPKIETNIRRDRDTDRHLRGAGWMVLRFWEHESPELVAESIIRHVQTT